MGHVKKIKRMGQDNREMTIDKKELGNLIWGKMWKEITEALDVCKGHFIRIM